MTSIMVKGVDINLSEPVTYSQTPLGNTIGNKISSINLNLSTYFGGSDYEYASDFVMDEEGYIYIVGTTNSTDFPTTPGAISSTLSGEEDCYLMILYPNASKIMYSTYLGGALHDEARFIRVDTNGSIYIVGQTKSSTFPTTSGAYDQTINGGTDIFVTKINPNDWSLNFSTFIGTSQGDYPTAMEVNSLGQVYIAGGTWSSTYPTTLAAYDTSFNFGGSDIFLTQFDDKGSNLLYSTFIGGSGMEYASSMFLANECVFLGGYTESTNFPTTIGAFQTSSGGDQDGVFFKLNLTNSELLFSSYIGGNGEDWLGNIQVDGEGCIYLNGATFSSNFPLGSNGFQSNYAGGGDIYLVKFDAMAQNLFNSTYLGGTAYDGCYNMVFDADGDIFLCGFSYSDDFPMSSFSFDNSLGGTSDGIIFHISSDLSTLYNSTYLGGDGYDTLRKIFLRNNSLSILGYTDSLNYPIYGNSINSTFNGGDRDCTFQIFQVDTCYEFIPNSPILNPISSPSFTGNVSLSWNSVEGALTYETYRYNSPITEINGSVSLINSTTLLQYEDTGLLDSTYYYVVVATNLTGSSSISNCEASQVLNSPIVDDPDTKILARFENDILDTQGHTASSLNIDYSDDAIDGFYSINLNGSTEYARWFDTTDYSQGTIECFFQPSTVNYTDNHSYMILSAGDATYGTLVMNMVNGIVGVMHYSENGQLSSMIRSSTILQKNVKYHLAYSWGPTGNSLFVNGIQENSSADTRVLHPGTLYLGIGKIYSYSADGNTFTAEGIYDDFKLSDIQRTEFPNLSIVLGNRPLKPILNPMDSPNFSGNIPLSWNTDINVDYYNVYQFSSPIINVNSSLSLITTTIETSYLDLGLAEGTYYYAVTAINGSGESLPSNTESVVVQELISESQNPLYLNYSTLFGGTDFEMPTDIVVDDEGFIYIVGTTNSTDFPTTFNAILPIYGGNDDCFLVKISPDASKIIFSTYIGGSAHDEARFVAVDPNGYIYVVGQTKSTNFPITSNAYDQTFNGITDVFICKINPDGMTMSYSTYIGTSQGDYPTAMDVDEFGQVFIAGGTWSSSYPTTLGAFDESFNGVSDMFLTQINQDGSDLVYSTFIGGSAMEYASSLYLVDECVYVGGYTESSNFPITSGTFQNTYAGNQDCIFFKLNLTDSVLDFSTYIGGTGSDWLNQIIVDGQENIFITVGTYSSDFPSTGEGYQASSNGNGDMAILKFDPHAVSLLNSTFIGGMGLDGSCQIVIDSYSNIVVGGYSNSDDFPTLNSPINSTLNGQKDLIFCQFTNNLSILLNSTYFGGDLDDIFRTMSIQNDGIYIIGYSNSENFPILGSPFTDDFNGGNYDCSLTIFNLETFQQISTPTPTILNAVSSPDIDGNYTLSWNSITDVLSYNVYRYTGVIVSLNSSVILLNNTPALFEDEIGVLDGTYYYVVTAVNGSGESEISNCVVVTVEIPPIQFLPESPILNIVSSPDIDGNYTLSWNSITDVLSYNVYRYTGVIVSLNSSVILLNNTPALFEDEIGVLDGTYYYVVTAVNGSGESEISNCVVVTVEIPPIQVLPESPILNIVSSPDIDGNYTLSWNSIADVLSYNVYRYTGLIVSLNDSVVLLNNTPALFEDEIGVLNGTYYYVVTAVNGSGESGISNCVVVTVEIPPIEDPDPAIFITNGVWQNYEVGLHLIKCIDSQEKERMFGAMEVIQAGKIRLTYNDSNPTSDMGNESAALFGFYRVETQEMLIKTNSFSLNFYIPENNFLPSEMENLCIYELTEDGWIQQEDSILDLNDNSIKLYKINPNAYYAIGIKTVFNSSSSTATQSPFTIPGFEISYFLISIIIGLGIITRRKKLKRNLS
ncbi:SBBP repeat-containing protein [Candidatus Lokiarchaeum ossiferum]|uniref:SBBP repeat-containing protein n=1 Tax=Candidatus Lokiarchaeum ossiferum TaxID=2951803 RepID=UPI00352ECFCF